MAKVVIVSFFPKTPSRHQEDIRNHGSLVQSFEVHHHIQSVAMHRPRNIQLVLAGPTKCTPEKEVFRRFFNVLPTKQTIKVVPNVIMPPLEHVPCVETIG